MQACLPGDVLRHVFGYLTPSAGAAGAFLRVCQAWHAAVSQCYYHEVGLTLTKEPPTGTSYKGYIGLCGFTTFSEACAYLSTPRRSFYVIMSYFDNPAYPLKPEYFSPRHEQVDVDDVEGPGHTPLCCCCSVVVRPDFGVDRTGWTGSDWTGFDSYDFYRPMTNYGVVQVTARMRMKAKLQ